MIYLNCPGGSLQSTLPIYDVMQTARCGVATYAIDQAIGPGALILCAGRKGKRFALPRARVGLGDLFAARAGEPPPSLEDAKLLKMQVAAIFLKHSGRSTEQLERELGAAKLADGARAKALGLVDDVAPAPPVGLPLTRSA
jgi:ATP-dependent Clp protease protease subunit